MLRMAGIAQFVDQKRPGQVQIMTIRKRSIFLITAILSSVIILAAIFLAYCSYRYNKVMEVDTSVGINEGMYETIGGTQQWIQIRGKDRSNPVILWLNGGPGYSTIPQTFFHVPLEKDFTVVMWDQRGEGKSYAFTGPSIAPTMTIERMAADGVELAEFLKQHLGVQKIVIMGHSWGSILGVRMVQMRPDLFSAYVGTGQVVNLREAMELEYPSILDMARSGENDQAVEELEAAGPPPYSKVSDYIIPIRWANAFDAVAPSEPGRRITFAAIWAFFKLFVLTDKSVREGIAFSQDLMLEPMLDEVVPESGTSFEIPVLFIQGSEDKLSPTSMVRQYYDAISAPKKKMIVLDDAGHLAILRNRALFRDALLDIKSL